MASASPLFIMALNESISSPASIMTLNTSASSTVSEPGDFLECPTFTEQDSEFKVTFSFWVEGVAQTLLAVFGILGNILSCFILTRKEMRNSFNLLLVTLAAFDSWYLFGAILESLRKSFRLATDLHILMFPYFLYPLHQTSMTGSIFLTVAIAFERYSAVHLPHDYNQSLNDSNAMWRRLLKYIIPVCVLSFLLNVPKFLEAEIEYLEIPSLRNQSLSNLTSADPEIYYKPVLSITSLRTHPLYSNYNNWSRLFLLGIIPFALLVFFNVQIYRAIRERKQRKLERIGLRLSKETIAGREITPAHANSTAILGDCIIQKHDHTGRIVHIIERPKTQAPSSPVDKIPREAVSEPSNLGKSPASGLGRGLRKSNCSLRKARSEHQQKSGAVPTNRRSLEGNADLISELCLIHQSSPAVGTLTAQPVETDSSSHPEVLTGSETVVSGRCKGFWRTRILRPILALKARRAEKSLGQPKNEDNLAVIFMGIILIFLLCHFPRIMMNIHELAIIHRSASCAEADRPQFSLWSLIMISVSHVLLVLNSATNMIVYCLLSPKFRRECIRTLSLYWMKK